MPHFQTVSSLLSTSRLLFTLIQRKLVYYEKLCTAFCFRKTITPTTCLNPQTMTFTTNFRRKNRPHQQKEQHQVPPTKSRNKFLQTNFLAPHHLSDFGNFKYKLLGTREKVRQARAGYLRSNDVPAKISSQGKNKNCWFFLIQLDDVTEIKSSAAAAHYLQVQNTGKCQKPILKVIPVHLEHPNSSVIYTPHCTVLFRCADDTGCCENDATCQYKQREEVTLYFYVRISHYSSV